jgi:hypothetical protein
MNLFRYIAALVLALAFGAYLAACDWNDRRKAGADAEGEA